MSERRRPSTPHRPATQTLLSVTGIALLVLALPNQAATRPHGTAQTRSGVGDKLVIAYWSNPEMFVRVSPASHLIFEPLFRGSYTNPGQTSAALVTKWEGSEDGRTWTYYLRSNVRWHDGIPLTAFDVEFSQDLRQHPAVGEPGRQVLRVLNDTTVEITYLVPTNPTPWLDIWPKHLLEDLDPEEFWEWDFWSEPVGSGPYRYVRQADGEFMELEANPDYYAGPPAIDRVIFRFDPAWEVFDSVGGDIDAFGAPVFLAPDFLANNPDYRAYSFDQPVTGTALGWNNRRSMFADPSVRRALTMAINRRALARLRGFPEEIPVRDVLAPQYPSGIDRGPATAFDPDQARRLLTEAGWADTNGDGVRDRDGEEFSFSLLVADSELDLETARHVRGDLAEVGVDVTVEPVARARTARDAFLAGETDAAIFRASLGLLARVYGEESPVGFDDAELVGQWEAANASFDPDRRRRHLVEAMSRFREILPVTVLLPDVQFTVAHWRVRGLRSPDRGDVVEFLSELWIEEDEGGRSPRGGRLGSDHDGCGVGSI